MTPRTMPVPRAAVISAESRQLSGRLRASRVRPYLLAFEREQARTHRTTLERVANGLAKLGANETLSSSPVAPLSLHAGGRCPQPHTSGFAAAFSTRRSARPRKAPTPPPVATGPANPNLIQTQPLAVVA